MEHKDASNFSFVFFGSREHEKYFLAWYEKYAPS